MIVSPDSKHAAVILHGVLQIQSKETSKTNIFGTKETTLTASEDIRSASFAPSSDVLIVATNNSLQGSYPVEGILIEQSLFERKLTLG